MGKVIKDIGFNLDNSYLKLPNMFYSKAEISPSINPEYVLFNTELAKNLGFDPSKLAHREGLEILSGNTILKDGVYIAEAYAGHQFGYFTMLGDGRATLIGEQITPLGERYDIQLKGSGITPYSRRGDGKASLGPMLREYIISEAMYGLGIPTTRSLAVIKTGETVYRTKPEEGALLCRIASSHIRFGTFQYAFNLGSKKDTKALVDYCIERHFPDIKDEGDKYLIFLRKVIKSYGRLIAKWQSIGFIHGVMNTDNMSICAETIDYGPCAFMDTYNPNTVFSSIDTKGRYSFKNQPIMAEWNLCRLAESILFLLKEDSKAAVNKAQEEISSFKKIYELNWISLMRSKLGIFNEEKEDESLVKDLLNLMDNYKEDYTNTFLALTFNNFNEKPMFKSKEFKKWQEAWHQRLKRQMEYPDLIEELMKNSNPAVIPRNHRVEEALSAAEDGDYSKVQSLLAALSKPYTHENPDNEFLKEPNLSNCEYKTYCGT